MRSYVFSVIALSAVALTATSLGGIAGAQPPGPAVVHHGAASTLVVPTPSQTDPICISNNGTPIGTGIPAQHFEPEFKMYDARGAADFRVRRHCEVVSVDITGMCSSNIADVSGGCGPSNSVQIQIREDAAGRPGKIHHGECAATLAAPGPNFTIPIGDCVLRPDRTFWLTVQVDHDLDPHGRWYWATTNKRMRGNDLWRNPRDGYGTGCTAWGAIDSCFGRAEDFLFSVNRFAAHRPASR